MVYHQNPQCFLYLFQGLNMAIDYRKASHIDDAIEAEETD
jgi:hypothetical protein